MKATNAANDAAIQAAQARASKSETLRETYPNAVKQGTQDFDSDALARQVFDKVVNESPFDALTSDIVVMRAITKQLLIDSRSELSYVEAATLAADILKKERGWWAKTHYVVDGVSRDASPGGDRGRGGRPARAASPWYANEKDYQSSRTTANK